MSRIVYAPRHPLAVGAGAGLFHLIMWAVVLVLAIGFMMIAFVVTILFLVAREAARAAWARHTRG